MLAFGPFEVHLDARQLRRDGEPLALRDRGFELLLALLEQPGQVLSKRRLCERAWPGADVDENNLQVEISALRKLIGARAIVTAHGRGYQFALPVTAGAPSVALASLTGRDADLAALLAWMAPGRLVTVVGEAGVGKSRLVHALAQARQRARCTVALAELHGLRTPEQALGAIAAALQRTQAEPMPSLVLDGCDGVLAPVAEHLASLVAEHPGLALLATSRAVLHVPGERVYRLAPLAPTPALQLFAQLLWPQPADHPPPTPSRDAERAAAFDLCDRLGGNPLAIVLAAQQTRAIGLVEVQSRVAASAETLVLLQDDGRGHTTPAHHRSLRTALAWGDAMPAPAEAQLFVALSTLPQPFTLDQALALPPAAALDNWDAVETLGCLVDRSWLQIEPGEPPCYRLTALMRLHAADLQKAHRAPTPP